MLWQYGLVFIAAFLVDATPFPLPPAFTVMILLQIIFNLSIWPVILIGVLGSILGRYILILYIPSIAERIFKKDKNADIHFLGDKIKNRGLKAQFFILLYTLMPLPSTPLFVAGGLARMKAYFIIPAFTIGKLISDSIAVNIGKYASENSKSILMGILSWKYILAVLLALMLLSGLIFIDWRSLLKEKKFSLRFNIWR